MKKFMVATALLVLTLAGLPVQASRVVFYSPDQGDTMDLTSFIQNVSGIQDIISLTALNSGNGEGDELLLVAGESHIAILDATTFSPLGTVHRDDFRQIFGLGSGAGTVSAYTPPGSTADLLLYRDTELDEYFVLDFTDMTFHSYAGPDLPDGYVTGFSYTNIWDDGVLYRDDQNQWFYDSVPSVKPVSLPMAALFNDVPDQVTEYEWHAGHSTYRFLAAVLPGQAPTPTPTPDVPPTPTPDGAFDAVLAMSLGETLDVVNGDTYQVSSAVATTGASPNQIVVRGAEFFVVNSLSNSIGVYDSSSFAKLREFTVGPGRNPMNLAFLDNDRCYVSNLISNTVSLLNIRSGDVETEIAMPDSSELPHDEGVTTWARPGGVFVSGGTCYVVCSNLNDEYVAGGPGVICRIDTGSHALVDWFESGGRNPVTLNTDDRWPEKLWISNAGDYSPGSGFAGNGTVAIWNMNGNQMDGVIEVHDAPFEVAFGPDRAYAASAMDGTVIRLDLTDLSIMPPVALPDAGHGLNYVSGLALGPDNLLWALEFNHDMLYLLDPGRNDALIRSIGVGSGPDALAFVSRGR